MLNFITVLGIVLPIFALVYIGYYFRKQGLCTDEWVNVLNKFVYYVSLPAVIIVSFWDIQWRSAEIWTAVGWNMAAYLTFAILVFLSLHSLKHLSGAVKSAMFMVSMVGNTVYIGFPILIHALGSTKAPYVIAAGTAHLVLGLVLSILAVDFWVVKSKKLSLYVDDLIKNPFMLSVGAGIVLSLIGLRGSMLNVVH
ncbi:MAG: AEC family transporter, partial [Patescibacteria group bacterium]